MTTVRRAGVEFEVILRRSGIVRLLHRDGDEMVDDGEVCRWERIPTHRIVFVRLYDGIFPPRSADPRIEAPRQNAPGYVVDEWLALNQAVMS